MKHTMKNKIHLKLICFVFTFIIAYINDVKFKYKTSWNNYIRNVFKNSVQYNIILKQIFKFGRRLLPTTL